MTLYELHQKAEVIGRQISNAHIPVLIDNTQEIESIELSEGNKGNCYVNIKMKRNK